jgi:hypothetical protein
MKGFLLVILLALFIIIAITSGIFSDKESSPATMIKTLDKANMMLIKSDLKRISDALDSYFSDHGHFPQNLGDLVPFYLRSKRECFDPWQTEYRLEIEENESGIFIKSAGKDRVFGNSDDIRRRIQ